MTATGDQQILHRRGNFVVRRQKLAPGEATPWHHDPYERVSVVVAASPLAIEFRDGSETLPWNNTPGEVNWLEPTKKIHRAVNIGQLHFEEVVTFFLDRPDADPQPESQQD